MSLADGISFTAVSSGTGSFVFGSSRASFRTLLDGFNGGALVDAQQVSYLAQDSLSTPVQREWGHGTYGFATSQVARTTILGNSVGGTSAIAFNNAPVVSLTILAADLKQIPPLIYTMADASTTTFDAQSGRTDIARLAATGSRTVLPPTNPVDGQRVIIEHTASTAAFTLTLSSTATGGFRFGTDITALSATATGTTDEILVIYNTSSGYWRVAAVTKGF